VLSLQHIKTRTLANYSSIPQRFNKPTSSINISYIDKILEDKQKTLDENLGVLQESVTKILGTDLVRPEDREYLKSKVDGVLNTMEATDSINFDSKKSKYFIQNALQKASRDPEILKQVANTSMVRQAQEFAKKRMTKGDLDQKNFQYAWEKSGISDYMAAGSTTDVTTLQYMEREDWRGHMNTAAQEMKAMRTVKIENPETGTIESRETSTLTSQEMRDYLLSNMSNNDREQIKIDGALSYGMDNAEAMRERNVKIAINTEKYESEIKRIEGLKNNKTYELSPAKVADYDKQIKGLNTRLEQYNQQLITSSTAEAIGGTELLDDFVNYTAELYTRDGDYSLTYDSDYKKRIRDLNESSLLGELGIPSDMSSLTTSTNLEYNIDPLKDNSKRIMTAMQDYADYETFAFNSLSEDKNEILTKTMNEISQDGSLKDSMGGKPITTEVLQRLAIEKLGYKFFPPNIAAELRGKKLEVEKIDKIQNKIDDEYLKSKAENGAVYAELIEESRLTIVTPESEVSYANVLKRNNIKNEEGYKTFIRSNKPDAKMMRATLALQTIDLTGDIFDSAAISGITSRIGEVNAGGPNQSPIGYDRTYGPGGTSVIDLSEYEFNIFKKSAQDIMGEQLEDTYDVERDQDGSYKLLLKNPNTQVNRLVERTENLKKETSKSRGKELFMIDINRTSANEGNLSGLYSEKKYQTHVLENMDKFDRTVASTNSIRISGALSDTKASAGIMEVQKFVQNIDLDLTKNTDFYPMEDGSLKVTQLIENTSYQDSGKGTQGVKAQTRTGFISSQDLKNMPMFNRYVNTSKQERPGDIEDMLGERKDMSFNLSQESLDGLNSMYGQSERNLLALSTEVDAKRAIFADDLPYLEQSQEGMRIISDIEDMFENTQDYSIDLKKGGTSGYLLSINKKGKELDQIPITADEIPVAQFKKAYNGTPQIFLARYAQNKVAKYINKNTRR
jgi:hypothetical protein